MTPVEIDEQVAKKLGLQNVHVCNDRDSVYFGAKTFERKSEKFGWNILEELPPYSTSIEAAWKIVEWMLNQGHKVSIRCDPDAPGVDLSESDRFTVSWPINNFISAPTAPLAICLAFLKLDESK